jgi:hypothetical protein
MVVIMKNIPAFPSADFEHHEFTGMTLRDFFAAKAMQAMTHRGDGDMYFCSAQAYKMADAMLKAREA